MRHGTYPMYRHARCRCDECTRAQRDYQRDYRQRRRDSEGNEAADHDALSDLLNELFPFGLTDDCPARRKQVA